MLDFNYSKALAQAAELRRIAGDMLSMNNRALEEAINEIQGGWHGDTARQFLNKCNDLKGLIEKEAANIRKIADNLESSARSIEASTREAAGSDAHTASISAMDAITTIRTFNQ